MWSPALAATGRSQFKSSSGAKPTAQPHLAALDEAARFESEAAGTYCSTGPITGGTKTPGSSKTSKSPRPK